MGRWNYMGHVVNNAMAIKAHALWWRVSGDERDRAAVYDMMAKLDRYHGMATGVFTGDECLAGLDPAQGTELCAVVEYMYSLEHLLALLGDPAFGDRLEQIAFNALPATFSPDMWAPPVRPAGEPDRVQREAAQRGTRTGRTPTSSGWSRTTAAARPT